MSLFSICCGKDWAQTGEIGGLCAITSCFDQRWDGTADMAGVLQGLVMGSPGRTGWDDEECMVLWGFLFWECHGDSWSSSFWVNEESVERCGSDLAVGQHGLPGGCLQEGVSVNEWGAVDIVYLEFLRVVAVPLVTASSTKWWKYRLDKWTVR